MAPLSERLESTVLHGLAALPPRVQRLLAGAPVSIDGQQLHPEMQLLLKLLERFPRPSFETLPVDEAREEIAREARLARHRPLPVDRVERLRIPTAHGAMRARLYAQRPPPEAPPLLVYLHGGGWVLCDLDTHDDLCRFLAREAGVVVLSVDYRRAPENPFPAALEDALSAFQFAIENAAGMGADPGAVAVGGDSAGGNLAAALSQLARAGGGPMPAFQLLLYPVTDLSAKRRSYSLFRDGFFLTERQMDWYRDHYLPDSGAALDPRASPLLADDLSGLPPAYIATAGFDPLRDEGEEYARRLREVGVAVGLRRHSGLVHGFANMATIGRASVPAMRETAGALRMGLAGAMAAHRAPGGMPLG